MTDPALIRLGQMLVACAMTHIIFNRRSLKRRNQALQQCLKMSHEQTLYLAEMLDKYKIPLDEFDLIALNLMAQK